MDSTSDWRTQLSETGTLTAPIVDALVEEHGDRAKRAITAACEARVKQYNDFIVVVGHHDEYIVEDNICQCDDTLYNLEHDDPDAKCWHQLAAELATTLDILDTHDLWYSDIP